MRHEIRIRHADMGVEVIDLQPQQAETQSGRADLQHLAQFLFRCRGQLIGGDDEAD